MKPLHRAPAILLLFIVNMTNSLVSADQPPLKALLIAGGCCHDYANQQKALSEGIQSRANVRVDVYWTDDKSTSPVFPLYADPNWAAAYDVIIHDECAAAVKDTALLARVLQTHQKIPAVHLHCAMHSFRTGTDAWFKHLGLQSSSHGPQKPIDIDFVDREHPITATLKNWTTINEELYNNVKLFDAHPLAIGRQNVGKGGQDKIVQAVVAWTNETQGARSFSTTIGHNTKTVEDPRYLDLVTRGLLWACGKLSPEYLHPYSGSNTTTMIEGASVKKPEPTTQTMGPAPKNATLVKLTASSTQTGNPTFHAVDGKTETRWCANGASYPAWLQLEFESPRSVRGIQIDWEFADGVYAYVVEGSADGKSWQTLLDRSEALARDSEGWQPFSGTEEVKTIKITGRKGRGWCSIREVRLQGDGIGVLWPAAADSPPTAFAPLVPKIDPFKDQGNNLPRIEPLSADALASIRNNVKVPEGFEFTVFAAPPAVNYPVFVAAAPDGTLYVSSDGNGSLGRNPQRGRVIRLRDLDGDGRADETKVFCKVDAPRGLVWDHDRLYLMHPPHLSAFIDHDGDGKADEEKVLVKNLAFGYDKRPADHTTNGVSMGVDGWLYIAGGDFGFIDAEGTDGRKLTHRGGGVIRVRPDGTGLEVYSTGTRNILEVAISPRMDMFARDNTNDGGGWDVRLHHFTGMDDHGYPRLYKNFSNECVPPLADYGGGSGCGAVYLDEPGFGRWNDAPLTADWGTGALYRHSVAPQGATFTETAPPEPLVRMTRPTDADVDAMSRLYCASWRGATFNWAGPDVGYIVCVRPQEFQATPLPDFAAQSEQALVSIMESSASYRRRMAAQRELQRRGSDAATRLLDAGLADQPEARQLVRRLQTTAENPEVIQSLMHSDPVVIHVATRVLAARNAHAASFKALDAGTSSDDALLRALAMMHNSDVVDGLIERLSASSDDAMRRGILAALCRLHYQEGPWNGASWGTRPDTRGPYYQPEAWSETSKIAAVLHRELDQTSGAQAAFLVETMGRNRIQSDGALAAVVKLAKSDAQLIPVAVSQFASASELPTGALPILHAAALDPKASATTLGHVIATLSKVDDARVVESLITAMTRLEKIETSQRRRAALNQFKNAICFAQHIDATLEAAGQSDESKAFWADVALLAIADRAGASPEAKSIVTDALNDGWADPRRRSSVMRAALEIKSHHLDEKILVSTSDADPAFAAAALAAAKRLGLEPRAKDTSPLVSSLSIDVALQQAITLSGSASRGEQLFTKANCIACHTVSKDQQQKGPYLGNIAKTYKRPELAAAVLQPAKTIAQGFATNAILSLDGTLVTGFVTAEQSDRVMVRDQKAKEYIILKDDIDIRKTLPTSVMPDGIMNDYTTQDVASLVTYLESLSE